MPNINYELMPTAAFIGSTLPIVSTIPAAAVGITGLAKSLTIISQSEMGVRTRSGDPMLKPEIYEMVTKEICDELPERRIRCLSQIGQLSRNERTDRIQEKIDALPEEIKEAGVYRVVGKGRHWLRPFIDDLPYINIADQTTAIHPFELESEDDRLMLVTSSIVWNIRKDGDNVYKTIFAINNEKKSKIKDKTKELEQTVEWICRAGLGKVLSGRSYSDLKDHDGEEVADKAKKVFEKDLIKYGVNIDSVRLAPIVRTAAERISMAIEKSNKPVDAGLLGAFATSEGAGAKVLQLVSPNSPPDAAA